MISLPIHIIIYITGFRRVWAIFVMLVYNLITPSIMCYADKYPLAIIHPSDTRAIYSNYIAPCIVVIRDITLIGEELLNMAFNLIIIKSLSI
jgi:hypothetical protein